MDFRKISEAISEKGAALRLRLFNMWQQFREMLRHRYRFVMMETDTFKEKFAFNLTGANVFVGVSIGVLVFLLLSMFLIAFTPLRELVPGYVSPELVEQTYKNAQTIDSLERIIDGQEHLLKNISNAIEGKPITDYNITSAPIDSSQAPLVYKRSREDSLLRVEMEQKRRNK